MLTFPSSQKGLNQETNIGVLIIYSWVMSCPPKLSVFKQETSSHGSLGQESSRGLPGFSGFRSLRRLQSS